MSLTPIFDGVCTDLGFVPIATTGIIRSKLGTFAYDLLILRPPSLGSLTFGITL